MKRILLLSVLALTACESTNLKHNEADFWQRSNVESAMYMRGPKAQHQLHKDIANCVAEVKELSRLGTIRDANPPSNIELQVGLAKNWQSPKGDGPLHTEFRDFHDFESCMAYKGWERTLYVKPEVKKRARTNYDTVVLGKTRNIAVESSNPSHSHRNNSNYNN